MIIAAIFDWNRRNFSYLAKCEHCNSEQQFTSGYDDANYYNNVIPNIKCNECGESSNSKSTTPATKITKTRYDTNLSM